MLRRTVSLALVVAIAWASLPASTVARSDAGEYAIARVADGTERAVAAAAAAAGATDVVVLDAVGLVTLRGNAAVRTRLAGHPSVRSIALDSAIALAGTDERSDDENDDNNGTGDSPGAQVLLNAAADNGEEAAFDLEGRGVAVAVLDTGIARHHDLGDRIIVRVDLVKDGATSFDPAGHGTHVAGLIAGVRRSDRIGGVARGANLVDVRVLDKDGRGTVRAAVAAFDWVLKNRSRYGIKVVNVSWGAPAVASYHDDPLAAAVEAVWFAGVTVVVSAGNGGPRARTVTSPGNDPFVITVGSLEDRGTLTRADDRASEFSSIGPTRDGVAKPDVLAPGRKVVSLRSKDSTLEKRRPDRVVSDGYMRLSGTSVSAALVAGAAAVLLQKGAPTPSAVKAQLIAGGTSVPGSAAPSVDVRRSLTARGTANPGLVPSRLLMRALSDSGQVKADNLTWENITWEGITWENITWEGITWERLAWERLAWENITWEHAPH